MILNTDTTEILEVCLLKRDRERLLKRGISGPALANLNDEAGATFKQIADLLEGKLALVDLEGMENYSLVPA